MEQGADSCRGKQSQALGCSGEERSHGTGGEFRVEGTALVRSPTSRSSFAAGPAGLGQVAHGLTQPQLHLCGLRRRRLPSVCTQKCLWTPQSCVQNKM